MKMSSINLGLPLGQIMAWPLQSMTFFYYRKTSSISHSLVGNKFVDHSDVVGASPFRRCSNYIFILDLTWAGGY